MSIGSGNGLAIIQRIADKFYLSVVNPLVIVYKNNFICRDQMKIKSGAIKGMEIIHRTHSTLNSNIATCFIFQKVE